MFTAFYYGLPKKLLTCKVSTWGEKKIKKITNSFYFKATSSCVLGVHFASHTAEDLQMFLFEVCQSLESVNIQFTWTI